LSDARSHFVRRGSERIGPSHVTARRVYTRRILFWGCFSSLGVGPLVPLEGTVNAILYQQILQSHLRPTALQWFRHRQWWYQHDNAPAHNAASTKQWLEDHRVRAIEWPPYSPDLNPIENLWAILKQEIHRECLTNREEVVERAVAIWNSPTFQNHCRRLVASMHQRCFDCVRFRGGPTGY
jgi:transposase